MTKLLEGILKNPYLVVCLVLAITVVGLTSLSRLPADLLPQFNTPAVQIVTFYPGMPALVMERDIMSRLERWTGQSVGIERQEAKAMTGVCIVKDFFREDISMDSAMSQVTSYAMSDMFYLPPGTIPPMVMPFDPTASVPLCLISVSSPTMPEKELYDIAYFELRNRLQSIQGVIAPAVYGGKLRRILAYVDPKSLEARNLSPLDVFDALSEQSVFIPTGNAKFGDIDYQVVSNAMPVHVEELNDIPIRYENGAMVFMRDVGEVKDSSQIQTNIVRINGRRQVYIPIYRQPGANTIEIVDDIKTQLTGMLQRLREMDTRAADLALEVVMDQSVYVRSSIKGIQIAAILGAILAGFVVLVALRSLRSTIVVVFAIPLSLLIAFIGMYYTGDTINSMTLGGLALAIGILVDQSIVVIDSITRHLRMGKSNFQAAMDGVREVALPVGVSTVTFLIVFFPIVFLTGVPRFLFQPLAIAVSFAVIGSYLISMVVIPSYCIVFLKSSKREDGSIEEETGNGWFGKLLNGFIRARVLVLLLTAAGVVAALLLSTTLGTELFPPVDSNQFTIYARLPSGTRIEITEETLKKIEARLIEEMGQPDPEYPAVEKYPDSNLKILISNAGVLMDWPAAYTPNSGPMDAFILLQLKGKGGMPTTFDYVAKLRKVFAEEFPGVEAAFDTGGMLTAALNFGLPSPINVIVQGSDLDTMYGIAQHIARRIQEIPGAEDVRVAQRMDYPELNVEVDRIKAKELGVTQEQVVKNIVTSLNSSINFKPAFWIDEKNGNHYFMGAQYPEETIESIETLKNIPITGMSTTRPASLRNIAEITRGVGPAVVNHRNITRTIDVFVNAESGYDVGTLAGRIEKSLSDDPVLSPARKETPRGVQYDIAGAGYAGKGYTYQMQGEVHTMRDSFRQFAGGFVIAAALVYLVMVAQLRSFAIPFVILLTVPMAFIGVALVLWLTGTAMSIPAFMGIIMIVGIVVEYSIILVDYADRLVAEGSPITEAVKKAAQVRLRPILMTSFTTWLALLPMAIGGQGGEANAPLARAIIGGVLAATVLTLFVVPVLYKLFKRESE
jgi:multidrug efflux pump subunit AcrB